MTKINLDILKKLLFFGQQLVFRHCCPTRNGDNDAKNIYLFGRANALNRQWILMLFCCHRLCCMYYGIFWSHLNWSAFQQWQQWQAWACVISMIVPFMVFVFFLSHAFYFLPSTHGFSLSHFLPRLLFSSEKINIAYYMYSRQIVVSRFRINWHGIRINHSDWHYASEQCVVTVVVVVEQLKHETSINVST